ncbi:MAG: hypothetical protein NWF08_09920 [Candidatus Bathyarchaeota archaeon]|nr:hypothetical protein [Candidatus Bathyarchaeota archaeon]
MNNSLRIGIISGAIAGLIASIFVIYVSIPLIYELGSHYWF